MKCVLVAFYTDLCGDVPGDMKMPQQEKVAESSLCAGPGSKDFSVGYCVLSSSLGKRNEWSFYSCVKNQS